MSFDTKSHSLITFKQLTQLQDFQGDNFAGGELYEVLPQQQFFVLPATNQQQLDYHQLSLSRHNRARAKLVPNNGESTRVPIQYRTTGANGYFRSDECDTTDDQNGSAVTNLHTDV